MNTTAAVANQPTPSNKQPKQTAKEVIAANIQALIEQLEQGHSEALTAYLTAMGKFHNYSFGNILEIARQKPDATRVAGLYAWNQLGRKVKKGERGIRILAPVIGIRRKKDEESEKDIRTQNQAVLVGFRAAYVFERLSRDLWPRFYPSIGPAMHPKVPDDSSQPYHRSIQLPSATASGNRDKQPPFNNSAAICSLPEPPGMTKFQVRPARAGVSAIWLA